MPLPALIYATQRAMDDYGAKDMHHGDLSEEALKERFGLTDVSAKVNPYTLTLVPPVPASSYGVFYPQPDGKYAGRGQPGGKCPADV